MMKTSVKWNELYSNEQELINDMLQTKSDVKAYPYYQIVKGYEYVEGFKRYYAKHGILTDKQMTMLKRIAKEIFKNVHPQEVNFI